MLEYIMANLAETTVIIGLILLIIEVWLLGMSTIVLLALGASAAVTGVLALFGVIPETIPVLVSCSGIGAGVLTLLLWRPLKNMQSAPVKPYNIHSDFIGLVFTLDESLAIDNPVQVKYSGVNWALKLSSAYKERQLTVGDRVQVVAVDVGCFTVEPLADPVAP